MDFLFQGFEPQPNFGGREEDTKRNFQSKKSVSKYIFNDECMCLMDILLKHQKKSVEN